MDSEKSLARRTAEWVGIVAVLGVCGWMMFGDSECTNRGQKCAADVPRDHPGRALNQLHCREEHVPKIGA